MEVAIADDGIELAWEVYELARASLQAMKSHTDLVRNDLRKYMRILDLLLTETVIYLREVLSSQLFMEVMGIVCDTEWALHKMKEYIQALDEGGTPKDENNIPVVAQLFAFRDRLRDESVKLFEPVI
ncbi:hypothetical protein ACHAPT_010851 [Fusarium lateritium]